MSDEATALEAEPGVVRGVRKRLLVERDPHRSRVALLEDGRLAEIWIERADDRGLVGNVYRGRVHRVLPGMQAAFVDIGTGRDAFLHALDVLPPPDHAEESSEEDADRSAPPIEALLTEGDEIVVQVTKDSLPGKGPRVTMNVSLPGRHLVLLPTERKNGISRRIEDAAERSRLQEIVESLELDVGVIVRTAGRDAEREEFAADARHLLELWRSIEERDRVAEAPMLLHSDLDVSLRLVRDLVDEDFDAIVVDDPQIHAAIVELLERTAPQLCERVRLHRGPGALLATSGVEQALEQALEPRVRLPSGGSIVITQTEALTAIDVNTGRYVGHGDFEQTILTTNLEAVPEIVRQIRLRDLGGIIVLDLIDMESAEHRHRVFAALERELEQDRVKSRVSTISDFGLVEITRKRSRPSLERLLTRSCPYCDGRGRIDAETTVIDRLRRRLLAREPAPASTAVTARLHPEVAARLRGPDRAVVDELERELGVDLRLEDDDELHREDFEIVWR